jgi:hypothetical protein
MFTRRPPYAEDSTANDRSKPPGRTGRLMREEWNKLWEILEVCWSTDPLDRPTASELEARLRMIFQPRSSFVMVEDCHTVTNVEHRNLPDLINGTAHAMSDEPDNLREKVFSTCSFI